MKRVIMDIQELSKMRHIIDLRRGPHVINTAAERSNVFYVVRGPKPTLTVVRKQKNNVVSLADYK